MPLQDWLQCNATKTATVRPQQIPWQVYFTFTCWNIWLARNERIFRDLSRSQHSIIYSSVQAATEFYYLTGTTKRTQVRFPQNIRWHVSSYPFITLNIDGSALGNLGIAGVGGILRDHLGQWISGFSLYVGLAMNNMAELVAVRQGLAMAWNMSFKYIQLELDSKVVQTWLTNPNTSYPTNMMPLICDCRSLLA